MSRRTSPAEVKSRIDQEYESDEEAKAAAVWGKAQPQAIDAPKKIKKTASALLVKLLPNRFYTKS